MGIIERRARDRQRRIMEILEGAKNTFNAKGFMNSTMNDIADISDLSRRTLYLYFHNKEEILLAIAVNTLNKLLERTEEIEKDSSKTGLDKLMGMAEMYRELFAKDSANFQFLPNFTNCVKSVGKTNEIVVKCEKAIGRISEKVKTNLELGVKDGSIRPIKNPDKTATILISIIHSFILSIDSDNDLIRLALHTDPKDFFDEALNAIYHYISAHPNQYNSYL